MNNRIFDKTRGINSVIKAHHKNKDDYSPGSITYNSPHNSVRSDVEHLIDMSRHLGRIEGGIAQVNDILMLGNDEAPQEVPSSIHKVATNTSTDFHAVPKAIDSNAGFQSMLKPTAARGRRQGRGRSRKARQKLYKIANTNKRTYNNELMCKDAAPNKK